MLFWYGVVTGAALVSAALIFDSELLLFLAVTIAGASGRGADKGEKNSLIAVISGIIISIFISSFLKVNVSGINVYALVGSSAWGFIPGWVHKLLTRENPIYLLYSMID